MKRLTITDVDGDTLQFEPGSGAWTFASTARSEVVLTDDDLRTIRDAIDEHLGDLNANREPNPRALVVIDPENRQAVRRMVKVSAQAGLWAVIPAINADDMASYRADQMQAALREFANPKPPEVEEPGIGGGVRDADGMRWVRGEKGWTNLDASGTYLNWQPWWNLVDRVVAVLSRGWGDAL